MNPIYPLGLAMLAGVLRDYDISIFDAGAF